MQRLKYIGRESAVLKDLKNPPNDLSSLYKLMLDECRRNRTKEQYEGLKKLFAWLAFSRRSLTLAEASEIARLTITEKDFDIEDEIFGRSERILGLSREEHKDEENRNEIKDDDTEDHGEDAMDDIEEKRKASLKFQERSLRQYFRAVTLEALDEDELRTPASAAHLSILTMCIDTLISSANANKNAKADSDAELPELKSYAVDYWYEHLKELDVSSASDDEVRQVLVAVHRILNNESNVARLFESYARHTELYPDRDSETATPWYDSLKSWAARASTISEEKLGQEVAVWSREIVANPGNAFLQLAKAHVENWKEESDRWRILIAYEFAASALRVVSS